MGLYLEKVARREWLSEHATQVSEAEWTHELCPKGMTPLCEFEEPHHSVLIAWNTKEMLRALPRLDDCRERKYYFSPSDEVRSNLGAGMMSAIRQDFAVGFANGPSLLDWEG